MKGTWALILALVATIVAGCGSDHRYFPTATGCTQAITLPNGQVIQKPVPCPTPTPKPRCR